jgi:hypothetical protein
MAHNLGLLLCALGLLTGTLGGVALGEAGSAPRVPSFFERRCQIVAAAISADQLLGRKKNEDFLSGERDINAFPMISIVVPGTAARTAHQVRHGGPNIGLVRRG